MLAATRRSRLVRAGMLLALCTGGAAHAAVFNVASGDVAGLVAAINAANGTPEADTINLAAGTYSVTTAAAGTVAFPPITSDVTIVGAGPASTIIELASVDGFRLLQFAPEHGSRIEGVTLRGGKVAFQETGAAILLDGDLTVASCVLSGGDGGAINAHGLGAANGGELVVEDTTISNNSATAPGTAIQKDGGSLVIRNSQITANTGSFGNYPAIALQYGGFARVTDTIIQGNAGGGMSGDEFGEPAIVEIVRTTIDGNSANITRCR